MNIEAWSDIICPFCYVGKRHLEKALETFPHRGSVNVEWKSFELDPTSDRNEDGSLSLRAMLAKKMGISTDEAKAMNDRVTAMAAAAGLSYKMDEAIPTNTFDAHRALHFAKSKGKQAEAKEKLMQAYFTEGKHVGNRDGIVALMTEIGLDATELREALAGDEFGYDVRADQQEARSLGVSGVPFFVFDRKYAISGAQPVVLFSEVLEKAWAERSAPTLATQENNNQEGCDDTSCAA